MKTVVMGVGEYRCRLALDTAARSYQHLYKRDVLQGPTIGTGKPWSAFA